MNTGVSLPSNESWPRLREEALLGRRVLCSVELKWVGCSGMFVYVRECYCAITEPLNSSIHTKLQPIFKGKPLATKSLVAQAALAKHTLILQVGSVLSKVKFQTYKPEKLESDHLYYKMVFGFIKGFTSFL